MSGASSTMIAREDVDERLLAAAAIPRRVAAAPVVPRAPFPRWLRVLDRFHTASFTGATVAADAAIIVGVALAEGAPVASAVVVAVAMLMAFTISRTYRPRCSLETQGVLWYAGRVLAPTTVLALAAMALSGPLAIPALRATLAVASAAGALVAARVVAWVVLISLRSAGLGLRRTVVVGAGDGAQVVVAKLRDYPDAGLLPVGVLASDGSREQGSGVGVGALAADLPSIIRRSGIENIVLVPEGNHDQAIAECLDLCDGLDVDFALLPPLSELFLHPGLVTQVGGLPLIPLGKVARTRRNLPGKRAFDLLIATTMLLLASPVMLAAALAVWIGDRGPILYRQRRVGQGGATFHMLKFRSMVVNAERYTLDLRDRNVTDGLLFKVEDDPRVTRVGRVIRRLSIDELPQLFNVLRGEMSIVGPRPLPVDPEAFGHLDGKRHSVPPGITGYWQIAGGNGLTYAEMVKLDLAYIQNWSLWLDICLVGRTIPALLHRRGPA